MSKIRYQHRDAELIPGEYAGEFAIRLVSPHAVQRVLLATTFSPESIDLLVEAATRYRDEYAATGLMAGRDSTPGRSGRDTANAIERMGHDEMVAWRAHNTARGKMSPAQGVEVDRVVLDDRDDGVRLVLLTRGLRALARHYGK